MFTILVLDTEEVFLLYSLSNSVSAMVSKNCKKCWDLHLSDLLKQINRLAVYSYLTRYTYRHSASDRLFTKPLSGNGYCLLERFPGQRQEQYTPSSEQARNPDKHDSSSSSSSYRGPPFQDLTSDNQRQEVIYHLG